MTGDSLLFNSGAALLFSLSLLALEGVEIRSEGSLIDNDDEDTGFVDEVVDDTTGDAIDDLDFLAFFTLVGDESPSFTFLQPTGLPLFLGVLTSVDGVEGVAADEDGVAGVAAEEDGVAGVATDEDEGVAGNGDTRDDEA